MYFGDIGTEPFLSHIFYMMTISSDSWHQYYFWRSPFTGTQCVNSPLKAAIIPGPVSSLCLQVHHNCYSNINLNLLAEGRRLDSILKYFIQYRCHISFYSCHESDFPTKEFQGLFIQHWEKWHGPNLCLNRKHYTCTSTFVPAEWNPLLSCASTIRFITLHWKKTQNCYEDMPCDPLVWRPSTWLGCRLWKLRDPKNQADLIEVLYVTVKWRPLGVTEPPKDEIYIIVS